MKHNVEKKNYYNIRDIFISINVNACLIRINNTVTVNC